MDKFRYLAPTEIIFGKGTEAQVGALCKKYGAHKVLIHYGGQSALKSGLIARVQESLAAEGLEYVLLGGVVPNPELGKVREGIALCKVEGVDFLLAVGGGSVIDSVKGIGYGLANEGDVWDYYTKKKTVTGCAPLGVVLTMSAAGSEMSSSSVITNEDGMLKRGLTTDYCYSKFSILNPELTFTVPAYQTASGCADIIMHTLERYFTKPGETSLKLVDGIAENLLRTVIQNAPRALENPEDYDARAEIMWCSTLSHNETTGERDLGDWACHQLEHELSGMFGVAHGAGLAAVWGSWARYVYKTNPARFAQLGVNVLGVPTLDEYGYYRSIEELALETIATLEDFFLSIGMPISIGELIGKELSEEEIRTLAYKCSFMGARTIGGFQTLQIEDMENIYRMAK